MARELERDLGLYAVVTVSIGAMIGSGIFVLPGLASVIAGPGVVLAYLLAGLLVLPAALSKAEMASAMPESGGTYLFIDRAMGPMLGTIAGLGTWFSLVFKSAFALVGLGAYLSLLGDFPVKPVAIGLALILVAVNVLGVRQTGRLQAVVVTVVMGMLLLFVADGVTYVERSHLHPFLPHGVMGLLTATGFVFVSYAGVTKIASVAEEVERPGRNIPLGILGSVVVMILVYCLVVLVVVGVTTRETLGRTLTPMADAAGEFLGPAGETAIAVTAILALTSMANAGILSSSRYPFAMSRDRLLPDGLGRIGRRFRTPTGAILATGVLLVGLVAVVPVVELAKLASAFQILVFSLVNAALVFLRESDSDSYAPEFRAPGYPWVQLAGIVGGLGLVPLMGLVPLVGAVVIVVGGYAWYRFYGRRRIRREGAAPAQIRRATDQRDLRRSREAIEAIADDARYRVLVALHGRVDAEREGQVVRLAGHIAASRDAELLVVRFERVPDQVILGAALRETPEDAALSRRVEESVAGLGVEADTRTIVSHDLERAMLNFAARRRVDLVLGEWKRGFRRRLVSRAPCDVVFVRPRGLDRLARIAVVADRGPHDPLEVATADAVARSAGAGITFVYALPAEATDEQRSAMEAYHRELAEICSMPVESRIWSAGDRKEALIEASGSYDLVVAGESAHRLLYDVVFGDVPDELADRSSTTVMLVNSRKPLRHTFLRWLVERISYS